MNFEKYYCYNSTNNEYFKQCLFEYFYYKKNNPNLKFVFMIDKESFKSDEGLKDIISLCKKFLASNVNPLDLVVSVDVFDYRYKTEEWNRVKELETMLKSKKIEFGFEDSHRTWTINEVENANDTIVGTADYIRQRKLSTFEKLLDAYLTVTSRDYKHENEEDHFSQSRSVFGVLNSDKIVCGGYAQMLDAIIKEVDDENLKIYINHVSTSEDDITLRANHANVIIYVKDEKYGLDGYYYLDPTWDAGTKKDKTLNYFMIPLGDIKRFKDPFIRNYRSLIKKGQDDKKTLASKSKKKTNKPDLIYNSREINGVSFTKDGFEFSRGFLYDYFCIYPEEAQRMKKMFPTEDLDNAEMRFIKLDKQKELLELIKKELSEFENKKVSNKVSIQIYSAIEKIVEKQDFKNIDGLKSAVEKVESQEGITISEILDKINNRIVERQNKSLLDIEEKETYVDKIKLANDLIEISKLNRSIDMVLLAGSQPMDIGDLITAFKRVLKSRKPEVLDSEIDEYAHNIIMSAAKTRKRVFSGFERTELSDYLDEMDANDN